MVIKYIGKHVSETGSPSDSLRRIWFNYNMNLIASCFDYENHKTYIV